MTKTIVIGDGIIGLSTALTAASNGWEVSIYTDSNKNKMTENAVSPVACALWYPALVGGNQGDLDRWCKYSYEVFHRQRTLKGIKKVTNYEMIDDKEEWLNPPPSVSSLPGFESYQDRRTPTGVEGVWKFDTFIISMDYYLPYLRNRLRRIGVKFVSGERILNISEIQQFDQVDIIFNCAGLGAADLSKHRDQITAVKGHLMFFPPIESNVSIGRRDFAIMPRNDYTVVGALFIESFTDNTPLLEDRRKILKEVKQWVSENALGLNLDYNFSEDNILFERTGLRPFLNTGVCLRPWIYEKKTLVVDNFGHGGSGVTISWGCAAQAVNIAQKALFG